MQNMQNNMQYACFWPRNMHSQIFRMVTWLLTPWTHESLCNVPFSHFLLVTDWTIIYVREKNQGSVLCDWFGLNVVILFNIYNWARQEKAAQSGVMWASHKSAGFHSHMMAVTRPESGIALVKINQQHRKKNHWANYSKLIFNFLTFRCTDSPKTDWLVVQQVNGPKYLFEYCNAVNAMINSNMWCATCVGRFRDDHGLAHGNQWGI